LCESSLFKAFLHAFKSVLLIFSICDWFDILDFFLFTVADCLGAGNDMTVEPFVVEAVNGACFS
jgi:hypothetical protein